MYTEGKYAVNIGSAMTFRSHYLFLTGFVTKDIVDYEEDEKYRIIDYLVCIFQYQKRSEYSRIQSYIFLEGRNNEKIRLFI